MRGSNDDDDDNESNWVDMSDTQVVDQNLPSFNNISNISNISSNVASRGGSIRRERNRSFVLDYTKLNKSNISRRNQSVYV